MTRFHRAKTASLLMVLSFLLFGCSNRDAPPKLDDPLQINPDKYDTTEYDFAVLLIGNSHTAGYDLPELIAQLLQLSAPDKTVYVEQATAAAFLDEHYRTTATQEAFVKRQWSHVILQSQKYSQSRSRLYSTSAAIAFIQKTKEQHGIPILYPEFGQLGNSWEGEYVHELHTSIADEEAACVAPVGLAWDKALRIRPDLTLHDPDGNHSNETGTMLTAYVLLQTLTGVSAETLPAIEFHNVSEQDQSFLQQMAADSIEQNPPCDRL